MTDDSDESAPSGTAETPSGHAKVELNLDPQAIEELVSKHAGGASEDAKQAASSSTVTHDLSLTVSDMSWGDFQSKLGSTSILSEGSLSLSPASGADPLHADLHADLIKQN